jgi:hypothetical protein
MFLTLLTPQQAGLFARAARMLIHADQVVHEKEFALLEAIQAETGLSELPEIGDSESLLSALDGALQEPTQRNTFLLELAGVAAIDADEHLAERELLAEIAQRLGLTKRLDEFLCFARDARELANRGQTLITTG